MVKPGYKQTEVGVIPEDWEVSTVGREFDVKLGKMLDAEKNTGVPKPYLGNRSVQWDQIDTSELAMMRMTRGDMERFRLRKGDLLACEGGEVGRAAIWHAPIEECYYQKALHRLRPLRGFDSRLMVGLLRLWSESGLLSNYVTQTSIAHLPREKFVEVTMPVPPLPEQQVIASALSDADELIESLEQLLTKKRQIKLGAMQELLTGKKRLPGFSGEWEVKKLGEVASFYKGKGLPKSAITESGAEPCIHYGELFTRYPETIGDIYSRTDISEGVFRSVANDVLMPTSDVTPRGLAKASCVTVDGVILGGDILVIRTDRKLVFGPFLSFLIRYEESQVLQLVTGSTVYHLYGSDMKKFSFFMPSISEQTAIAEVLSDMDAEIKALETKLTKARQVKQGMMQELLTGSIRLV
jgi:type I restriction enzyme S subunit